MADDWAGLSAQLGKMQQVWYVTQRSYWSVFDPNVDTATIVSEDGSTRQVPSWRALSNAVAQIRTESIVWRGQINGGTEDGDLPPGTYRVERQLDSDMMLDFSMEGGSARRLQIFARYTNELYFRVAVDTKTNWNGVTARTNRIWHSGNFNPSSPRAATQYTRSTLPHPGTMPGGVAFITDGPNGPTHVFSNGQRWRAPAMTDL